ncbi:hypothetical protein TWF730_011062 [Orbilia blumenaviensis]|uniref:Uncharacterized protein n=1 Tax=Orbilia blumenaviensis TaxID=1796055 RepID=A0AAV9UNS1_9PEZI
MSGLTSPTLSDVSGERASAFLFPEEAFFFTQRSNESLLDSTESLSYLPCGLKAFGSDDFIKDYDKISIRNRKIYVNKIVTIMSQRDGTHQEPIPLVFRVQASGDVVLDAPPTTSGSDGVEKVSPEAIDEKLARQYEPHFWIPDSCLHGIPDQEKAFRREFFAVGCLIYQILKGEMVWQGFLGSQAQDLFEKGVYPADMKELSHWRVILSYWSWEYVAEVNRQLRIKKALGVATKVALGGVAVGGTVALAAILSPLILPAVGFGSAGVGAGSIAAGWQSAIGLVEAGSIFALCQSAGAGGAAGAAAITAAALGGTGTVVAAGAVASATAGIENNVLRDEDLFALFLQVVRKAPNDANSDKKDSEPETEISPFQRFLQTGRGLMTRQTG